MNLESTIQASCAIVCYILLKSDVRFIARKRTFDQDICRLASVDIAYYIDPSYIPANSCYRRSSKPSSINCGRDKYYHSEEHPRLS